MTANDAADEDRFDTPRVPASVDVLADHPLLPLVQLLGRRWTIRLLIEMHPGAIGFREMRARTGGVSTSVLSVRLGELVEAGIVAKDDEGRYVLTGRGYDLAAILMQLKGWAEISRG